MSASSVENTLCAENVAITAVKVVKKRRSEYGSPKENFQMIGKIWSAILDIHITPDDVALMMIGLKLAREAHKHSEDNLVDICGYALCVEELRNEKIH